MKCVECGEFMAKDDNDFELLNVGESVCWRCMSHGCPERKMGKKVSRKKGRGEKGRKWYDGLE